MKKRKLQKFIKDHQEHMEHIWEILVKTTKRTKKEVRYKCLEDRAMFADQAVKFGLLDGLWEGKIPYQTTEC